MLYTLYFFTNYCFFLFFAPSSANISVKFKALKYFCFLLLTIFWFNAGGNVSNQKKQSITEFIREQEKIKPKSKKYITHTRKKTNPSNDVVTFYHTYLSHRYPYTSHSLNYITNHFFLCDEKVYIYDLQYDLYPIRLKSVNDFPPYIQIYFFDITKIFPEREPFDYMTFISELLDLYNKYLLSTFATPSEIYFNYLNVQSVKYHIPLDFFNPNLHFYFNHGKIFDFDRNIVLNYKYHSDVVKHSSMTHSKLDDTGTLVFTTDLRQIMPKSLFKNICSEMLPLLFEFPCKERLFQYKSQRYSLAIPCTTSKTESEPLHIGSFCTYDWSFWQFICKMIAILYVRPSLANLYTFDFSPLDETEKSIDIFIQFLNKLSGQPTQAKDCYFNKVNTIADFHNLQCTNHKYVALNYHPHFTNNSLCNLKNILESKKIIYNDFIYGTQTFRNKLAILYFSTKNADIDYLQTYLPLNIFSLTNNNMNLIKSFLSQAEKISFDEDFIFTTSKYGFKLLQNDANQKKRSNLSPKESVLTFLLNCSYKKDENILSRQEIYDAYINFAKIYQSANLYSGFTVRTFITLLKTVKPVHMKYKQVHTSTNSNQYYIIGLGISLPKSSREPNTCASEIISKEEFQKRLDSMNNK